MQEKYKYILVAIGSFLLGCLFFWTYSRSKNVKVDAPVDTDKDKTIANEKDGNYFLVFNSVEGLTREVTKDQYDLFLSQFPSGVADGNVIDLFSTMPNKYTEDGGKYYESVWNGDKYGKPLEISKDEYDYETEGTVINEENT